MKSLVRIFSVALAALIGCSSISAEGLGNKKSTTTKPEWLKSAVIYEANLRQGTNERNLEGLQKELPRLHELGVDVIWLMPIHPISEKERKGKLGSYYAVQDYLKVNPEFGNLAQLCIFVKEAHNLGMKVIIDEVCNHTGADNVWVKQHPEYYDLNEEGKMHGIYDWTDVLELNYENPYTCRAMIDALKYWITKADIDGYRCDVAGEVPTNFWNMARAELQQLKPIMMLAEASKPELMLHAFDVDYAWPMKDVFDAIAFSKGVNTWISNKGETKPTMNAQNIPALIEQQKAEYPQGCAHMNMVTNHDLNSWEGTEFDRYGEGVGAFAVLSYTLPGIPMMYTGQEVGFNHAFEFFDYDPVTPKYGANEFTAFYQILNSLKHNNRALDAYQPDENIKFIKADNDDILTFTRTNGDNEVTVIVNLSNEKVKVNYPKGTAPSVKGMTDVFSSAKAKLPSTLSPWQYAVFAK